MENLAFVEEISKISPRSTFLSVMGYRNEQSEVANYSVVFHMSYTNALKRSIATLEAMTLTTDLDLQAREELLASYNKSLSNPEKVEDREPAYTYYTDHDGSPIKGLKLHISSNTLHIYGLVNAKRVLLPGNYKAVNSKPITIAKKRLSSQTSVGKFRQFRLTSSNVDKISVENLSLLPPT